MKIAVNTLLSEIRKKTWENLSLDSLDYGEPFLDPTKGGALFSSIEKRVFRKEMVQVCNRLIKEKLTDHQREALVLHMKYNMPLDEVAKRLNTNRNNIYKLLHDARKKLKEEMQAMGMGKRDVSELE